MSDHLDRLARFIHEADYEALPESVIERAKMVLIDTVGIAIYANGRNELFARTADFLKASCGQGASRMSRIWGVKDGLADSPFSALLNGAAAHSKQLDEAHWGAAGHPASYVVPAVLSVAETRRLSGKEAITGIVVGYEVAARLGSAYKRKSTMHPCGTYGIVGSAAAVGKLLKQDPQTLRETIRLSANLTLATTASSALEGASVHDLFTGFTNFMGVLIPWLAECGFRGETRALEMVFGTVSGDQFNPEVLTADLGTSYEIEKNFFKLHAVCGRNLSAITAFEDLWGELGLSDRDIDHIRVETYRGAVDWCSNNAPDNELAAKFSIPFALSAIAVFGNLFPDVFSDEHLNHPRIRELCSRVEVAENPDMTALIPRERPAKVTIRTKDGREYSREVLQHAGERDRSYSFGQIRDKFSRITAPILGNEKSQAILEKVGSIENVSDINELTALFVP